MRVPGKTIGLVVAGVAAVSFGLFVYPGGRDPASSQFAGACRTLPPSAGVGDIAIDSERGIAYLAYLDRAPTTDGKRPTGTIMLVDLNVATPRVRAALASDPPDFRPIALSLHVSTIRYSSPTLAARPGMRRLFVVDSSGAIHVFDQEPSGAFALTKSIRDAALVNPTAIVAVGPEQFYVTTDPTWLDPATSSRLARWWQLAMPAAQSSVLYFNGRRLLPVASGLKMAAGITASPDNHLPIGHVIYVSEMGSKRVQLFDVDVGKGTLKPRQQIALGSRPNHLSTDADGTVWIAAHPRIVPALKSLDGTRARVPAQVLNLRPGGEIEQIYRNDGSELAGATAVAARAPHVLVGSLSDPRLLLCKIN